MPVLREKQFCKIPGCHVPSCPTWLSSHVQYLCSFLCAFLAVTHLPTSGQRSRYSKRLTYRLCYRGQRGSILAYGTQQQGGTQVYFSLTPSLPLWLIQLSLRNLCQRLHVCQVPIFFLRGGVTLQSGNLQSRMCQTGTSNCFSTRFFVHQLDGGAPVLKEKKLKLTSHFLHAHCPVANDRDAY